MPASAELKFRPAGPDDAQAVAALHAHRGRRHYRGAYSDAFLDDEAAGFLADEWTSRLAEPDPRDRTILAELDGAVAGLAHTVLDRSETWGALLDNLHVAYGLKRQGIGSGLLAMTARTVLRERPSSGLYLWVLEQNAGARAFYAALDGVSVQHVAAGAPGGDTAWLNGSPMCFRIAWRDPARLLSRTRTAGA
jgi:ribosomal protein S18 acetylase RimI-like enzyme